MSIQTVDDDAPLFGCDAIAVAANLFIKKGKKKGQPNAQKAARLLRLGLLPGDKMGDREWTSTRGRLRDHFAGKTRGPYSQVVEREGAKADISAGEHVAA
jgi:hypothetical protein